mmetsp:Transcript_5812/g.17454  ORF Transcript_5812/g.17454 Transcript_5812/m.17454 type:complete len:210 (+) Transcript_5812:120-749(+)
MSHGDRANRVAWSVKTSRAALRLRLARVDRYRKSFIPRRSTRASTAGSTGSTSGAASASTSTTAATSGTDGGGVESSPLAWTSAAGTSSTATLAPAGSAGSVSGLGCAWSTVGNMGAFASSFSLSTPTTISPLLSFASVLPSSATVAGVAVGEELSSTTVTTPLASVPRPSPLLPSSSEHSLAVIHASDSLASTFSESLCGSGLRATAG